ncbi:hypothetical protein BJ875DRAFT_21501 [Amylocarpus encephaloides]|uniref:Uncharacterized protein n=1 Tax=Amylocarpus encephaloides TaxID=45428 RepID=A0A9P7Y6Y0_9HELO|nr:hypothetical protein BJ875DRAFT_21501 [Amylocarpus encephaloides]
MSLFNLPLSTATLSRTSRVPASTRKRKCARVSSDSSNDDRNNAYETYDGLSVAASTNPLSLTSNEIAQYRLAGLSLDEELPSEKGRLSWPHQGLRNDTRVFQPSTQLADREGEHQGRSVERDVAPGDEQSRAEVSVKSQTSKSGQRSLGHRLRMQHFGVLTAILHRSLLERDIPRATRAYSLLLRTEPSGQSVDIKSTGYWAIGAELLIRSQERPSNIHDVSGLRPRQDYEDDEYWEYLARRWNKDTSEKEWGSALGFERAKSYYETLILQYPYKKMFHKFTNGLDFWPAMVACEIYGIQSEQRKSWKRVAIMEDRASPFSDDEECEQENYAQMYDQPLSPQSRRRERNYHQAEEIWTEKDNIRLTALNASESLATRMDETIQIPPFDKDASMLHLRGMLALYIGDLSLPAPPNEGGDDHDDRDRRLLFYQRGSDHKIGRTKRQEEFEKARRFFEKLERECGEAVNIKESLDEASRDENDPDQRYSERQDFE